VTIQEVMDEGEACIELNEFGGITLYPFEDSHERIDQLRNARQDAQQWVGIHQIIDTA